MQKWEYRVLEARFKVGKNIVTFDNGVKLDRKERMPLHDYLNKLGLEGWQATSPVPMNVGGSSYWIAIILKRLIE